MLLRPPLAAGNFYDIDKNMLRKQLDFFFRNVNTKSKKTDAPVRISPHDQYIHSGQVAAYSYTNLNKNNFIIIGANHFSIGSPFALMKNALWKTPVGEATIDDAVSDRIMKDSKLVELDATSHEEEFSIEVQLPFLLHKFGSVKMVPILVNNDVIDEAFIQNCKSVGRVLGRIVKSSDEWKLIGSSHLSRSLTKEQTVKADKSLLRYILKLDADGLLQKIAKSELDVCGYGALATTIFAAKEIGAKKSELLKYGTSLENEGKPIEGYASIIFY